MALHIDQKYISLISPQLEKFKRKNQKTYNFRCPLCGDSSKSKIKARGYLITKGDVVFFYCHNCLRSWPLARFLKEINPKLYEQYVFENYRKKESPDNFNDFDFKPNFKNKNAVGGNSDHIDNVLGSFLCVDRLPDTHFGKIYISNRQIPLQFWRDILFVPDFKILVDDLEPDNEYALKPNDPRLVIPFKNASQKIIAFQGRSFNSNGLRYITIKVDKDAPKIYGLDRVNPKNRVYVVEGVFDSMFLPNSIAAAGSNLGSTDLSIFDDVVFIYDNEPRNGAIVQAMINISNQGKNICVWPDNIKEKDINDMILSGKPFEEIIKIINENIVTGLKARIKVMEWKRC